MHNYLRIVFPLLILLSAALSVTLAQDNAEPAPQAQPTKKAPVVITPLAIGNTWVYENKADGILSTDRVDGMVLFDGQPWYLVRTTERPIDNNEDVEPVVTELWLTHLKDAEADALVEIDEENFVLKLTNMSTFFRHKVAAGDVYRPNEADPAVKVEVLAVGQKVETKAGTFSCTVYRETIEEEEGYSFTAYVAAGVGIVRYVYEDEGQTSSTDLIRYTLVEER